MVAGSVARLLIQVGLVRNTATSSNDSMATCVGVPVKSPTKLLKAVFICPSSVESILLEVSITKAISSPQDCARVGLAVTGTVRAVEAVALLFALFESADAALTVAVLENEPSELGVVMIMVMDAEAAFASVARVQVTVVVPEQVHPVPVAEFRTDPAGNGSETDIVEAVEGPLLVTLRV